MEFNTYEEHDGQLVFNDINTNLSNYVAMSNNLIMGRQNLTLQEFKLVRLIIMQIIANDLDFRAYEVSPADFARIIGNQDISNIYHVANKLCDSLMSKKFQLISDNGSWMKFNWTSYAAYDATTKKMRIKLNSDMKPLLLRLVEKGYYSQYTFDNIAQMTSTYAGRLFEMLLANIKTKQLPEEGVSVVLTKQQIVDGCMLYKQDSACNLILDPETKQPIEKYERISQLKEKVIKKACEEITDKTMYYVPFKTEDGLKCHGVEDIKSGKSIVAFKFYINMIYHPNVPKKQDNRVVKIIQTSS